jgi:hypothetical protein
MAPGASRPVYARVASSLASVVLLAALFPAAVAATAPTNAPTSLAPNGTTVSVNPTMSWAAVSGAVKYRVQISTSPAFSTLVYNVDTYNRNATPPTDLPLGDLYWRVAGTDGGSGIGPFATATFTKDWNAAPTLTTPADGATLSFPTTPVRFSWSPLAGAKSYTLELDDEITFNAPSVFTTNNTTYSLVTPQTVGQVYYWRVRANSTTSGIVSEYSEVRSYTFDWPSAATLTEPDDGDTLTDIVFEWDPVPGARTYTIQVSPNGDWANNVIHTATVKSTRYSPPTTLDNDSYFWRIRATDAVGNIGEWSTPQAFTRNWLDQPTTLSPDWDPAFPDDVNPVGVPTLVWTPIHHASYYQVQISTDSNFISADNCFTNHTRVTPYSGGSGAPGGCTFSANPGTLYFWRVRGIDAPAGILGLWSSQSADETFRFIYLPDVPTLVNPTNGETVDTPTLEWLPTQYAERYTVHVLDNADGEVITQTTYATSYTPDSLDPADGPFTWYVTTIDGEGNPGVIPSSLDWETFAINPTPATDDTLDILSPADAATSARMPKMTWMPRTGAAFYKVRYGPSGGLYNATPLSGSTELEYAGFTYASLPLTAGTYKFKIEAYDGVSGTPFDISAEQTFTIHLGDVLDSSGYQAPPHCATLASCDTLQTTPTLSWDDVPGAGAYHVWLARDAQFTNVIKTYSTIFTTLTPRESLLDSQALAAYYWFIQPCVNFAASRCGPAPDTSANVNARAFRKASTPVTLLSPANGASVPDQITFTWEDYLDTNGALDPVVDDEAKTYKIEVSTVADFSSIFDTATVDQTTYTAYSKTYPEGPLYWRVQAIDGSNNPLTMSATRTLTKASPALTTTAPTNGAIVSGVPFFAWNPQDFAASYTVEVYKNGDTLFAPANKVLTGSTKFSAWAPTTSLPAGVYAWRVRRLDADNRTGPWSAARTFTLQPAAPALTSPANGAVFRSNNLLFTWTAVPGAVQYRFEASTVADFATLYASQNTVMRAWAPTTKFGDGTFYWRVKTLDASGNVLATSSSRSFLHDTTLPTVTSKTPTSDAGLRGPFTVTFSEQVKGLSATTFKMVIAGTATAIPGTVTPSSATPTTTATFVPTSVLMPGQSYTLSLTSGVTDIAGNALVPFSWTVRTALTIEQSSSAVIKVWDRDTNASASGGGFSAAHISGPKTVFAFSGTNVALLARKATDGGKASIYLDGVKQADVDFYAASDQWKVNVWSKTGLSAGSHSLEVRVLGTKQAASSGTWVYVDAFTVGAVSYEETSTAVKTFFRTTSAASALGGSYDLIDHVASGDTNTVPTFKMSFYGTDVDLYATKGANYGKANVYVDGALKATVDFYAAATTYAVKVYDSPTLTGGIHTVEIRVTGTKSAASTGTVVSLDQIRIK